VGAVGVVWVVGTVRFGAHPTVIFLTIMGIVLNIKSRPIRAGLLW
jgi:xanthosine utilization system XapX-like protein